MGVVDEQSDELPVVPWPVPHGQGFRAFMAENGEASPDPDAAPEVWVAWFLDARWEAGVEVYDVQDGPLENEWP